VQDERQRALVSLAVVWVLRSLLFWTVVPGHRPRHISPAQPAVALLAAVGWACWRASGHRLFGLSPVQGVAILCVCWLVVKGGFVVAMHQRPDIRPTAEKLRNLVPEEEILGLIDLKDEGLLFAYGRPARRGERRYSLAPATQMPRGKVLATLPDSQGEPLHLVRREPGAGFVAPGKSAR